jgi:hypothetical protein
MRQQIGNASHIRTDLALFDGTDADFTHEAPNYDGICEVCHTMTAHHRNDGSAPQQSHNDNVRCTNCHTHPGTEAPGDAFRDQLVGATCTGCHTGVPGTVYVRRDVVGSDYTDGAVLSSRHVFGGTVTDWDCVVCHREGDESAAAAVPGTVGLSPVHQNAQVDMRNVDDLGDSTLVWNKFDGTCSNGTDDNITDCVDNGANWFWNTNAMLTDMDNFCMGCHDVDGASTINVRAADDGVHLDATRALTPFNSTDEVSAGKGRHAAHYRRYLRIRFTALC